MGRALSELLRTDQSIRYLINDEVVDYVHHHRLYRPGRPGERDNSS